MEHKTKIMALGILAVLVVGAIGATGVAAATEASGKIIINGEDVTDQFVDDSTELIGTYTADSTSVYLAKMYAEHYLPYLESGCNVDMYYHGPYTTRITISVSVTAGV